MNTVPTLDGTAILINNCIIGSLIKFGFFFDVDFKNILDLKVHFLNCL